MDADGAAARHQATVLPEWIDDNEHMNLAFYVLVFADAAQAFAAAHGLPASGRITQMHTSYEREVTLGDGIEVATHVAAVGERAVHLAQAMRHAGEGYRAATFEAVLAFDDALPAASRERLATAAAAQPAFVGRRIGMARRDRQEQAA